MYGTTGRLNDWAALYGYVNNLPEDEEPRLQALLRANDYIQYRYLSFLCPGVDLAKLEEYTPYEDTDDQTKYFSLIEKAVYLITMIEIKTPRFFSTTYTPAQTKVLTEVKGVKWTVVGESNGAFSYQPVQTMVDAMFAPYFCDPNAKQGTPIGILALGPGCV